MKNKKAETRQINRTYYLKIYRFIDLFSRFKTLMLECAGKGGDVTAVIHLHA